MITKEEIVLHGGIAPLVHVYMDVACWRAHETMPRLSNAKLVAGREEGIEVVLFGGDVDDRDHDVDDRLRRQSGGD